MGEWNKVFEDEVEGRLVAVKVYRSDDPADDGEAPAVRVTTTSVDDYPGVLRRVVTPFLSSVKMPGASSRLSPTALDNLKVN